MKIIRTLSGRNVYFTVALGWTLVIAFLCLVSFKKLPTIGLTGADKYVHVTLHFVLTVLWFLYFDASTKVKQLLLKIVITSVLYGIAIEFMQEIFTLTRKASVADVFANTLGALAAAIVIFILQRTQKRNV